MFLVSVLCFISSHMYLDSVSDNDNVISNSGSLSEIKGIKVYGKFFSSGSLFEIESSKVYGQQCTRDCCILLALRIITKLNLMVKDVFTHLFQIK